MSTKDENQTFYRKWLLSKRENVIALQEVSETIEIQKVGTNYFWDIQKKTAIDTERCKYSVNIY